MQENIFNVQSQQRLEKCDNLKVKHTLSMQDWVGSWLHAHAYKQIHYLIFHLSFYIVTHEWLLEAPGSIGGPQPGRVQVTDEQP